jgi:hypothetical protein
MRIHLENRLLFKDDALVETTIICVGMPPGGEAISLISHSYEVMSLAIALSQQLGIGLDLTIGAETIHIGHRLPHEAISVAIDDTLQKMMDGLLNPG